MERKILINFFRFLLALLVVGEYTLFFKAKSSDLPLLPMENELKAFSVFVFGIFLIYVCNIVRDFINSNSNDPNTTFTFLVKIFAYIVTIHSIVNMLSSDWGWWILSACLGVVAACFDEMQTEEDFDEDDENNGDELVPRAGILSDL